MKKLQKHFAVCGALILALLAAGMPQRSFAQQGTGALQGKVVDEASVPVVGASVVVKGSAKGASTNADGSFTLSGLTDGDVLEISFLGYDTQEVAYHGQTFIDVTLHEQTLQGEAVVVTALGIKRSEKALSYNLQKVDGEEILRAKDANFINSLNGKIAGVTINKSSVGAGGATRVIMRGAKSLEGNNGVLYVIDGIPLVNTNIGQGSAVLAHDLAATEGIADFNPEDIESISVLSGPSAAALYGSDAANGVILVTTKKGQEGAISIGVSSSTEFNLPYMMPKFQNIYGNKKDSFESWGERLSTPSTYDPRNDFFQRGSTLINSVTLTTGNKHNQTFASISYADSKGIVPNMGYDRLNLSVRNTSKFLRDKMTLDIGASYIRQTDMNMVSQGRYDNPVMTAYLFPRGESWDAVKTFERWDQGRNIYKQYWPLADKDYGPDNPYWTAYRNLRPTEKNRYMFNVGFTYEILDWLNIGIRYRMDDSHIEYSTKYYATTNTNYTEGSDKGFYSWNTYRDRQIYGDAMLNIDKQISQFRIVANIGWSISDYGSVTRGFGGPLKLVPNMFAFSNVDTSKATNSESGGETNVRNNAVFANLELSYKSMLYLTLTGRNDWNSRLVNTASQKSGYFYPSVGLSAIISEMANFPEWFSYLKVRGSYTEVGAPVSRSGLTPGTITTPLQGGLLQENGIFPFSDFKPERTRSYEAGLELRLWNSLKANVTYYHSNTYNQTFLGDLPESSGYTQIYLQAGNVQNSGWEASLGYENNFRSGFSISTFLTFSRNVNVIKEMVHGYVTPLSPDPIDIPVVLKDDGRVRLQEGGSLSDIYADRFLKKDHQGYVEYKDGNYTFETTEPRYLGRTTPDFTLGWNTTLSYKGVTLNFLFNGRFGGIVTSSTEAILDRYGVSQASAAARETGGYMLPNQGIIDAENYYKQVGVGDWHTSGYYAYKATNIRLQELSISYTFPNKWFKNVIKGLTISFIANNPWMIYCKAPFDPELTSSVGTYGQGNDYFMAPSIRSYAFSIKFKL